MSQVRDAVQRGNPRDVKRVLNLRGEDVGTDTAAFGGILSATQDTVQKALDAIDDIFASAVSITGDLSVTGNGTFISTDAGAAAAPDLILYRNSASPADNDILGRIKFDGEDDVGNQATYAAIQGSILDTTFSAGIEGSLDLYAMDDGTLSKKAALHRGLVLGSPTGGDKGTGTLNATAVYDDNVQIKPVIVFRSSGSAITANATHTFAHSLGAEPDTVVVILQCTTADLNWSVGDRVVISTGIEPVALGSETGIFVQIDSTNVTVYVTDDIQLANKTTFEADPITIGSWQIYVKAAYFN